MKINLSEPVLLLVSPPNTGWGFYQFPRMWKGDEGNIYISINIGADSLTGKHEIPATFVSKDKGKSFKEISLDKLKPCNTKIRLKNGIDIILGWNSEISLYHSRQTIIGKNEGIPAVSPEELGMISVLGPFLNGYGVNETVYYKYGDLPEALRYFPIRRYNPGSNTTTINRAVIENDNLLLSCINKAGWWDDENKFVWEKFQHRIKLPFPGDGGPGTVPGVIITSSGTLLWMRASQHPEMDKNCTMLTCYVSIDQGYTWQVRSILKPEKSFLTWGYTKELALAVNQENNIICTVRTKQSNNFKDSHHLALFLSEDEGYSWRDMPNLSEFSVTPSFNVLENGYIGATYGRPGVHVKATRDGRTWSKSIPIIGPSEDELMDLGGESWWAIRHDISCSNTSTIINGSNSFLVAYSDFRFLHKDGSRRKAIYVREVFITD